jgi:hypothetical protein
MTSIECARRRVLKQVAPLLIEKNRAARKVSPVYSGLRVPLNSWPSTAFSLPEVTI